MTAIAAVLALTSTPLLGQEASTAPEPVTEAPVDIAPTTAPAESTTTETTTTTVAEPEISTTTAPVVQTTTKRTMTVRKSATTARPVRTAAPMAANAAPATPEAPAAPPVIEASPLDAAPMAATPPIADEPLAPVEADGLSSEVMLPIAGAAGLGLLGLLGAGIALRRRRRTAEEEAEVIHDEWQEPAFEAPAPEVAAPAPVAVATAPIIAPPAPRHDDVRSTFRWGDAPAVAPAAEPPVAAQFGSHVEAAHHGPTPDNPSLSLKKRLKRAAFFDHRDALAAEGKAEPIAPDAGLPGASTEPETSGANQREFHPA